MLSRVADSLYWMSRYLERAENTIRQLDVTMSLLLDTSETTAETRWERLLTALGNPSNAEWNGDLDSMARMLIFDGNIAVSVTTCINAARENARQVREEISTEQWQRLNRLRFAYQYRDESPNLGYNIHGCSDNSGLTVLAG